MSLSYDSCETENTILFQIDFENFIDLNLTLREMVVCQMLSSGFNITEISKHQHCARETISRLVSRIRKKFLPFFEGR